MPFLEGTPTAVLQLDKPRTLGFTMGAMRRIKDKVGSLEIPVGADGKIPLDRALEIMPTWIWACLEAPDRAEISVEQLEDMLHPGNLPQLTEAIVSLFKASSPEASTEAGPTQAGPRLEATG
jgi:hypothetical protein